MNGIGSYVALGFVVCIAAALVFVLVEEIDQQRRERRRQRRRERLRAYTHDEPKPGSFGDRPSGWRS